MAIESLQELLQSAQNERWEQVDEAIPGLCDSLDVLEWVISQGLKATDGNLRDLAVSILEKSRYELRPEDQGALFELLEKDENPHVRYRTSFALFSHGDRSERVKAVLREALQDEEVRETAQGYLNQLDN